MPPLTLDDARSALRATFGYDDFRTPQIGAVQAVLRRADALIVLPTGGGKSLCFQIPALLLPGLTVVVSPLISLMADQVQALQKRGVAAEVINSTVPPDEAARRLARLRRGEIKLLYVAPERLVIASTIDLLRGVRPSLLAVDEAHCVSEWGHDFRPSYLRIRDVRRTLGMPQTVALTATATPAVRRDIRELLGLRAPVEIVSGFDRPNLRLGVATVANEAARVEAMGRLVANPSGAVVVYAATRRQVEHVVRLLAKQRIAAVGYHAGLSPDRRARAQESFMSGRVPIIAATNAFGMGIDKADVRLVLHFAMSGSLEDYYQEAGRAGRDGGASRCILLFHPRDRQVHDRFRDISYPEPSLVRHTYDLLARESAPVRLDPSRLAAGSRRRLAPDSVKRATDFLQQNGLLHVAESADPVEIRLLASPLRAVCEEAALSEPARRILRFACDAGGDDWIALDQPALVARAFVLQRALQELEGRQLVYVRRHVGHGTLDTGRRAELRLAAALHRLEHRRAGERAKLDAMVGYAATRGCRREYILRYFGDESARATCPRCDNCDD